MFRQFIVSVMKRVASYVSGYHYKTQQCIKFLPIPRLMPIPIQITQTTTITITIKNNINNDTHTNANSDGRPILGLLRRSPALLPTCPHLQQLLLQLIGKSSLMLSPSYKILKLRFTPTDSEILLNNYASKAETIFFQSNTQITSPFQTQGDHQLQW